MKKTKGRLARPSSFLTASRADSHFYTRSMLETMSPAPATRKRLTRKKKKKAPAAWLVWLPVLLALAATPFAVRAASVLALSGPSALRLLYPYVVLIAAHAQHFSGEQADTLQQWVLWGQFPAYGLVWVVSSRLLRAAGGLATVLLLHAAGVGLAILTATA